MYFWKCFRWIHVSLPNHVWKVSTKQKWNRIANLSDGVLEMLREDYDRRQVISGPGRTIFSVKNMLNPVLERLEEDIVFLVNSSR